MTPKGIFTALFILKFLCSFLIPIPEYTAASSRVRLLFSQIGTSFRIEHLLCKMDFVILTPSYEFFSSEWGSGFFCFRNAPSPSDNSILSYGALVVIGKTLPTFCHNCDKILVKNKMIKYHTIKIKQHQMYNIEYLSLVHIRIGKKFNKTY